jgi:hypothetical protein
MLDDMEKTISMSTLAKNTERIAKDIEKAGTVYRIRRPGRRSMLLVDDSYLERWRATCEFIAQHPDWEREMAEADREYAEGKYIPLEVVLKELGLDEVRTKAGRGKTARARSTGRRRKAR